MADTVTPQRRSQIMARIGSKNTTPEMAVRRFLHTHGLRYRLHGKTLPGKPDLVFARRKVCVFVHGCFWHGCPRCIDGTRRVKSNKGYWGPKIEGNRARDVRHRNALRKMGWKVFTIWECETPKLGRLEKLAAEIKRTRGGPKHADR